jgi:hypothetical protein
MPNAVQLHTDLFPAIINFVYSSRFCLASASKGNPDFYQEILKAWEFAEETPQEPALEHLV